MSINARTNYLMVCKIFVIVVCIPRRVGLGGSYLASWFVIFTIPFVPTLTVALIQMENKNRTIVRLSDGI